jgi:hypothetical protein
MKRILLAPIAAVSAFACGLFVTTASAQNDVVYTYDELGRVATVCYTASGDFVTYQYDAAGNRSTVSSAALSCGPASIAIGNASIAEGGALNFTVTRTGATALTHAVNYATANGSAAAGSDYTAITETTLTFNAGETSKTISVATTGDTVYELNETVLVNLSAPTNGATISDSQGQGTITNNDPAPTFSISNASATAGNNLTFTITKSGSTAVTHIFNYATADGTATAGTHYTAKSGSMSFTSSQTSKTISVATITGSVRSGSKNMFLNLSGLTNGAIFSDSQGAGTINATPNSAPVAVNDTVTGSFDLNSSVNVFVLANDSDANGDPLTITAAGCASSGCSVTIVSGTRLSVFGTTIGIKTVNYTVSDGWGGTASATATVNKFVAPPPETCGEVFC